MMPHSHPPGLERRNHASRDALLVRVCAEFEEMPGLRLTPPQVQRLFGLRPDVCQRVLAALVHDGMLACDANGRYELTGALCRW
jgi:hypothetical protein